MNYDNKTTINPKQLYPKSITLIASATSVNAESNSYNALVAKLCKALREQDEITFTEIMNDMFKEETTNMATNNENKNMTNKCDFCEECCSDFVDHEDFEDDDMEDIYEDMEDEDSLMYHPNDQAKPISDDEINEDSVNSIVAMGELVNDIVDRICDRATKKTVKKLKKKFNKIIDKHCDIANEIIIDKITTFMTYLESDINDDINHNYTEIREMIISMNESLSNEISEYRNEVVELNKKYDRMIELLEMLISNKAEGAINGSEKKESKKAKIKPLK